VLVSAAVCPHPPLLVRELAGSAGTPLDDLLAACTTAIETVRATEPELLVVVGVGDTTRRLGPGAAGSFAPFGADVGVALPGGTGSSPADELPLSIAVGAWLLARVGWTGDVPGQVVAESSDPDECRRIGLQLAQETDRLGLLVMGDGTADTPSGRARVESSARAFDAAVVEALRGADPAGLMALDATLAAELRAGGRAPWQVLAGAAGDAVFDADVLYDDAPYGVGYVVAVWERHG
jgi:hypothetical protein